MGRLFPERKGAVGTLCVSSQAYVWGDLDTKYQGERPGTVDRKKKENIINSELSIIILIIHLPVVF